jgi:6,7-dimethyl-8-ribityllumazine synthase
MSYRIAIVCSRFNENITSLLRNGALEQFELRQCLVNDNDIFLVPGAGEIPVVAACLAQKKVYDAIVCLGAVIRGETNHYDYVCAQVSYGCQKIALDYQLPIICGILTTDNEYQALDRCGGTQGHKGKECADAALDMISVLKKIKTQKINYAELLA